ncbi:trypco2 family protein [Streptomyces sp. NPDC021056]|uniref:trypco2 family protein n=1 Tax=Streptomyces sp. NPDC021056 TaxID=3155012 RepID=UPI00340AB276
MIELATFIRELRNQLNSVLTEASPGPVRFELGPIEIEATIAVEQRHGGAGKVSFWVIEATADGAGTTAHTHRVTLTLQPALVPPDGNRQSVLITGTDESER